MGSCTPQSIGQPLINQQLIHLEYHQIGDTGMKRVIAKHHTRVIKELDVAGNNITPLSMGIFSRAQWTSLAFLNFNKNKLGDKGCKYLSMATLSCVQGIVLSQNNIGNAGVLHLSKTVFKTLKNISLTFNNIQMQGLQWLSKAKWTSIEQIKAYNNNIDEDFHLTSTIILVTSPAQALRRRKQKGRLPQQCDAFMDNGLLLQLY